MRPLIRTYQAGENEYRVMLADIPDYLTMDELAERLYSDRRLGLGKIDALILRPPVDVPYTSAQATQLLIAGLKRRAPQASLHILYSDNFRIQLTTNLNDQVDGVAVVNQQNFLDWLRQQELHDFAANLGALFAPRKNWLYRTPNKNPGGHLKLPHLWPGQTPPPRLAGRGDFSRVRSALQTWP